MNFQHWIAHWAPSVMRGLYQWQTLIAGLLALMGGLATVRIINAQIQQVNDIEEKRREREEKAAKSALPLALSELGQYGRDCIALLVLYAPGQGGPVMVANQPDLPHIPDGIELGSE